MAQGLGTEVVGVRLAGRRYGEEEEEGEAVGGKEFAGEEAERCHTDTKKDPTDLLYS